MKIISLLSYLAGGGQAQPSGHKPPTPPAMRTLIFVKFNYKGGKTA